MIAAGLLDEYSTHLRHGAEALECGGDLTPAWQEARRNLDARLQAVGEALSTLGETSTGAQAITAYQFVSGRFRAALQTRMGATDGALAASKRSHQALHAYAGVTGTPAAYYVQSRS